MVIKDGEKWACERCIRGHRVSSCQHESRQLHFVAKKGRPVSQCTHCRQTRKGARGAGQPRCDCGLKMTKCPHLQRAVQGHIATCCYNHGGPCSCVDHPFVSRSNSSRSGFGGFSGHGGGHHSGAHGDLFDPALNLCSPPGFVPRGLQFELPPIPDYHHLAQQQHRLEQQQQQQHQQHLVQQHQQQQVSLPHPHAHMLSGTFGNATSHYSTTFSMSSPSLYHLNMSNHEMAQHDHHSLSPHHDLQYD